MFTTPTKWSVKTMRAAQFDGIRGRVQVREMQIPEIDEEDALVRVVTCGICRSAFRVGLACSVAFGFAAGQMAFAATPLGDPLVPLGDASGFTLLVTDGGINSSDSAFQNGDIGLAAAGFTYAQSGGGETNLQQPTNALINTGSTVGAHPSGVTIVQNSSTNAFLAQAVTDATN